jgi:hypothetical protein
MVEVKKDYNKAVEMYQSGISAPKIAQFYEVSDTTIYSVLKSMNCKTRVASRVANPICSLVGCNDALKSRGYCSRHLDQFYTYGRIISIERIYDPTKKCSVEGCNRNHRSNGFCSGHHNQYRRHGTIVRVNLDQWGKGEIVKGRYMFLKKPEHINADARGYVKKSNIVWETHTGHVVTPPELIHHKNGDKKDDRFENLELFASNNEHQSKRHRLAGYVGVVPGGIII